MDNLLLRVRFAAVARIVVCSQGASGRESPDRPAAEKSRREISVSRPDFWYNIGVLRAWATMLDYAKQFSRAGIGRARSPSAPPLLRTWDASQESTSHQAPLAMHRRRFSFSAPADV